MAVGGSSQIPDTENVIVAKIAAALRLGTGGSNLEQRLQYFETAYTSISKTIREDQGPEEAPYKGERWDESE